MSFLRGLPSMEISDEIVSALEAAGVVTLTDLLIADLETIAQQGNCSYREVVSVRDIAAAHHTAVPVLGSQLMTDTKKKVRVIASGAEAFDKCFEGGTLTGEIIELTSASSCDAASRLCLKMALTQICKMRAVAYIDTSGNLSVEAVVREMKSSNEEITDERMKSLQVMRPKDIWEVISLVSDMVVRGPGSDQGKLPRVLILNDTTSLMVPLVASNQGAGTLSQLSCSLKTLSTKRSVLVMLVTYWPDVLAGTSIQRYWEHVPHSCVEFRQDVPNLKTSFRVCKSNRVPTFQNFADI